MVQSACPAIAVATAEGLSVFAADGAAVTAIAGIVDLFRGLQKSACAVDALAKSQQQSSGPKDAISGWTLVKSHIIDCVFYMSWILSRKLWEYRFGPYGIGKIRDG